MNIINDLINFNCNEVYQYLVQETVFSSNKTMDRLSILNSYLESIKEVYSQEIYNQACLTANNVKQRI